MHKMKVRSSFTLPSAFLLLLLNDITFSSFFAEASFDNGAVTIPRPSVNGVMQRISQAFTDNDGDGYVPVLLPISTNAEILILNRMDGTDDSVYIPIGRSYDGHDWERVAGLEVSTVEYFCPEGSTSCQVYLPFVPGITGDYYITSFQNEIAYSNRVQVSRFLSKATFGPTTAELDAWLVQPWNGRPLLRTFSLWVTSQINDVGTTSHREYYRKRLGTRSIEAYKYGIPGPKACQATSRWRKFTFTSKDLRLSRSEPFLTLIIRSVRNNGVTGYVLSFGGEIRTVVMERPQYFGARSRFDEVAGQLELDTPYKLCYVEEFEGALRPNVREFMTFAVEVNGECRFVVGGACKDVNPTKKSVSVQGSTVTTIFLYPTYNNSHTLFFVSISSAVFWPMTPSASPHRSDFCPVPTSGNIQVILL